MAGYSATPLVKKLGLKPNISLYVRGAPCDYARLCGGLPPGVRLLQRWRGQPDFVHLFTASRRVLTRELSRYRERMAPHTVVWVSWPKRASGVASEITEDDVRAAALPLGLVDVKVCAVDETWSGLKLVLRRELR